MLLIMGLGASGEAWEAHVDALARSFRCLIIDNRGTGASDAPEGPYSTALLADDAIGVLNDSGEASAGVIGISMGGAIAQEIALRHCSRVNRLILTASWAKTSPVSTDTFAELRELRTRLSPAALQRRIQLLIWSTGAYDSRIETLRSERLAATTFSMEEHAFLAQVDACITHDSRQRLAQVAVPTMITAGDADVFTPISLSEELAESIPGARMHAFSGGGHAHHWEQLERYNALCEEFLNDH